MAREDYFHVDRLTDSGCVAQINAKTRGDSLSFSFSIFREFERDGRGPVERTAFLNEQHLVAARRLIDAIERRISEEREKLYAERRRRAAGGLA